MGSDAYKLAEIGALVGDPTRANILTELAAGRALTASELAAAARITPQTVSAHLKKLAQAHVIRVARQGRQRYVTLASGEVAHMLEAMLCLTGTQAVARAQPPRVRSALKHARFCYDHLAGELGVALCDAWLARGFIALEAEAAQLTTAGLAFCDGFALVLEPRSRRPLCRTCLDWSERRPHLAGRLGAGLAQALLARGWIERAAQGRIVSLTGAGESGLRETFGLELVAN